MLCRSQIMKFRILETSPTKLKIDLGVHKFCKILSRVEFASSRGKNINARSLRKIIIILLEIDLNPNIFKYFSNVIHKMSSSKCN